MSDFHKHFPQGGKGKPYPWIAQTLEQLYGLQPFCAVDYGAGKGGTVTWLQQQFPQAHIHPYEPGIEQYASTHWQDQDWDCAYSLDVFEHIDPTEEHNTMQTLVEHFDTLVFVIDCSPARKTLPDGRNAHINLKEPAQWARLFEQYYDIVEYSTRTDKHNRTRVQIVAHNK